MGKTASLVQAHWWMVIFMGLEGAGTNTEFPKLLRYFPPNRYGASHYLGARHLLLSHTLFPQRYNIGILLGCRKILRALSMVC